MTFRPVHAATAAAAIAACLSALAVAAPDAQRGTRERRVTIRVVDAAGAPVRDLTPADLLVREDGVAREILSVTRAASPVQLALLVDDSQAAEPLVRELRRGLDAFLGWAAGQHPASEFALVTFGERPTKVVDFAPGTAVISRAASRIFARSGSGAYFLEAVYDTARALGRREAPRPVIVAFLVDDGPEFSNLTRATVADALRTAGAALWVVVLDSRVVAQTDARRERGLVITEVAEASGGGSRRVLDRLAIEGAFRGIAEMLDSQIEVVYARPDALIPPTRLEITAARPGLRVQATRWARE